MEHQPYMIKVSQLYNNVGMLAHALHTGINTSIEHQLMRTWECVLDIASPALESKKKDRPKHSPIQEVFIEPEAIHAYMKLQSSISGFAYASYLNDTVSTLRYLESIKHYLVKVAEYQNLNWKPS